MIKFEADEAEVQELVLLIDAAIKSLGIRGAGSAVKWVQKLEAAVKEAKIQEAVGG